MLHNARKFSVLSMSNVHSKLSLPHKHLHHKRRSSVVNLNHKSIISIFRNMLYTIGKAQKRLHAVKLNV